MESVILAFGLNNRSQRVKQTTVKQLQAAVRAAKIRFPQAEIWVPVINFSTTLPPSEQRTLLDLNEYITKNYKHIPQLPRGVFETERDKIHWTRPTAKHMLQHWYDQLN